MHGGKIPRRKGLWKCGCEESATRSWERQGGESSEQKKILCNRLGHLFRWGPVGWRVEMAAKCTSVALNGRWSRGTGIYGGRRREGRREPDNHE